MERITIKKLDLKPSGMLVVGYVADGVAAMPQVDATMNTGWQSQEVDFLMKDVRVGGKVEVEFKEKPNKTNPDKPYWNIDKVNMNDNWEMGLGGAPANTTATVNTVKTETTANTANPQRVGLFIKLAVEMMIACPQEGKSVEENLCENIQEIKSLEEFTRNLLEQ